MREVSAPGLLSLAIAVILGAARATPVIWMIAPLGGPRLNPTVRIGFALLLAGLAAPALASAAGASTLASVSASGLALLLAREVFVGFCLGFVGSAPFRAAEIAGRVADTVRGANIAEVLVPTADERSSPLGVLYLLVATTIFLGIGGVPRFLEALLDSFQTLPVVQSAPVGGAAFGATTARQVALVVISASARLIATGLALAAPVVVACLLADLALGLIARAAREVPVYFLGLPLKALLSVAIVLLGLAALCTAFTRGTGAWLQLVRGIAPALAPRP
jgi:type III secretory pathway component EscT